jgi:hypothetical protein
MLEVVAGIHDRSEGTRREGAVEPVDESGAAHAARKRDDR